MHWINFLTILILYHVKGSDSSGPPLSPCQTYAQMEAPSVQEYNPASVYVIDGTFELQRAIDPEADVYGFFNDQMLSTGWGILEFRAGYASSSKLLNVSTVFKAAGFMEGFLTARRIQQHRCNMFVTFSLEGPDPEKLKKTREFMKKQDIWTRKMVRTYSKSSALWRHVGFITAQLDGLVEGYQAAATDDPTLMPLELFDFQVLNGVGDLLDLLKALFPEDSPDFHRMTKQQLLTYVRQSSHCSALIKLLPGFENVFMSHSSWFVYGATNRIFKHYDFNTRDESTSANAMSFSSYPGFLESLDDYYMMNNDIVLIQTTNNIFDTSLYKKVKPESLLAWQRVRLANHLAANGSQWFEIVKQYNSGTYNNQYMVLDLTKIKVGEFVKDHALWVVEQIPGLVVGEDVTPVLRNGHWPSYNVPYFEDIYKLSGYPAVVKEKGTDFSYQLAPRAKIFRRDAGNVKDMESMKAIMRYNDFPNDKYSGGSPWGAICSRGDLDPTNPRPDGCYDTKVSDLSMARNRVALAINGPTRGTGLGVFEWKGQFKDVYHWGTPDVFNFTFIETRPILK